MLTPRRASLSRETTETRVFVEVSVDGAGVHQVDTGIGFFDHMLRLFARHGMLDLTVRCQGDLQVDEHHSVEDVGIVTGQALRQAIGDKSGIRRYGFSSVVHDESWAMVSLDFSGRPYLAVDFTIVPTFGDSVHGQLLKEFLRAFASSCGMTLHVRILSGENTHHIVEATFKALGRAVREGLELDPRSSGIPSTKGTL